MKKEHLHKSIIFIIQGLMFNALFKLLNQFEKLNKFNRRIFLLFLDFTLIVVSVIISNYFLSDNLNGEFSSYLGNWIIPTMLLTSILVYSLTGQYISLSRYIRPYEIYNIALRNLVLIVIVISIGILVNLKISNYKSYILLWVISTFINIISRFSLKEILIYIGYLKSKKINRVAIYGAGAAGAQLASSLILAGSHKIQAFFDDSPNLWGRKLSGIKIYPSKDIFKFKDEVDQVLLAIPSLSKERSRLILKQIQGFEIPVLKVPSIDDLTSGIARIDSLRPIEIEDLLGRGAVSPYKNLLEASTKNLNICITGAGGSIGREICRQIINLSPKSILLLESSEPSLYYLEQEISKTFFNKNKIPIYSKLGDAKDYLFVKKLFNSYKIDIVFHAAAYKHVPLIENNPLQGIRNNVLSTFSVCKAALETNVAKLTLISTDKAVRPTNVMGASKRMAELVLQAYSEKINSSYPLTNNLKLKDKSIKFSIVRFGNVLGSSGSVVPLFKKQIAAGGPITLTDRNVIRYFMTMPEAAQLVIQATSLSEGGDVFLLDMGDPVKIYDLAKQMIRLSGLTVKNSSNPNGDIEIITTGLRPGEKLYEELLIDGKSKPTPHPLIFRADENFIPYQEIFELLNSLEDAIKNLDEGKALDLLARVVPEWKKSF
tara:strand:- start:7684 stop:9657 length:1974 start_codon:yes stop_codon:yes gene_type:complete